MGVCHGRHGPTVTVMGHGRFGAADAGQKTARGSGGSLGEGARKTLSAVRIPLGSGYRGQPGAGPTNENRHGQGYWGVTFGPWRRPMTEMNIKFGHFPLS
jgi:hypothetical protein